MEVKVVEYIGIELGVKIVRMLPSESKSLTVINHNSKCVDFSKFHQWIHLLLCLSGI